MSRCEWSLAQSPASQLVVHIGTRSGTRNFYFELMLSIQLFKLQSRTHGAKHTGTLVWA